MQNCLHKRNGLRYTSFSVLCSRRGNEVCLIMNFKKPISLFRETATSQNICISHKLMNLSIFSKRRYKCAVTFNLSPFTARSAMKRVGSSPPSHRGGTTAGDVAPFLSTQHISIIHIQLLAFHPRFFFARV